MKTLASIFQTLASAGFWLDLNTRDMNFVFAKLTACFKKTFNSDKHSFQTQSPNTTSHSVAGASSPHSMSQH